MSSIQNKQLRFRGSLRNLYIVWQLKYNNLVKAEQGTSPMEVACAPTQATSSGTGVRETKYIPILVGFPA